MSTSPLIVPYRGRFAPSPSGPLHFGSLIAALGSFLDARSQNGAWLLRMEDIDTPRIVAGAANEILAALQAFGLDWDGGVAYQSDRLHLYRDALDTLRRSGLVYPCTCSRKTVIRTSKIGPCGPIYPATCRNNASLADESPTSLRVITRDSTIRFRDLVQGEQTQNPQAESGDFVIRRVDGLFTYQLAVVIDDDDQGISQIVRGADLLPVTPRQIYLQSCLGLAATKYAHLPLAISEPGRKLSKQNHAPALNLLNPGAELVAALAFLGQQPPDGLARESVAKILDWAIAHWNLLAVPDSTEIPVV